MEIFTEMYFFRLNVVQDTNFVWDTNVVLGQFFIQFFGGTD